jgi:hypothetical protein
MNGIEEQLVHEQLVVWLEDVTDLTFVREDIWYARRRQHAPAQRDRRLVPGRIVGYTVLAPDAPRSDDWECFLRRYFWLRTTDAAGYWPAAGVNPRTVQPGVPGTKAGVEAG